MAFLNKEGLEHLWDHINRRLAKKVNKEDGKGLSTNDFTTEEKTKLSSVENGAQVNVQPDWNQTDETNPAYIKNKPNLTGANAATELPSDNILQVNTMYFIGEVTTLSVGFPTTAAVGDMVYISFSTGGTTPTFTFTTNNHIGLDTINKLQNYNYELIGMWNGQEWVFAIHEVEI